MKWTVQAGPGEVPDPEPAGIRLGLGDERAPRTCCCPPLALVNGTPVTRHGHGRDDRWRHRTPITRSFTPRWGLTVHRRDLVTAPCRLGHAIGRRRTVPAGAHRWSSSTAHRRAAGAARRRGSRPWSAAPKARYVFWRAWFIPSATAGPPLDKVTIPANFADPRWSTTGSATSASGAAHGGAVGHRHGRVRVRHPVADLRDDRRRPAMPTRKRIQRARRSLVHPDRADEVRGQPARMSFCLLDPDAGTVPREPDGVPACESEVLTRHATGSSQPAMTCTAIARRSSSHPADIDVVVLPAHRQARWARSRGGTASSWRKSTVATPWAPGAIGAGRRRGGMQVDGTKGGVFRLRGSAGGARDIVELGHAGWSSAAMCMCTPGSGCWKSRMRWSGHGRHRRSASASTPWSRAMWPLAGVCAWTGSRRGATGAVAPDMNLYRGGVHAAQDRRRSGVRGRRPPSRRSLRDAVRG